jgi:hypothetical protein
MQAGSLRKYLAGSAPCAGRRVGNDANDVGNDANETCIGVATSAIACSALLAVLFGAAFFKAPSATLVPASVAITPQLESAAGQDSTLQTQDKPALLKPRQTAALEVGTLVVSKISDFGDSEITTQAPRGSRKGAPEALSSTQAKLREPSNVLASRAPAEGDETQLHRASETDSTPSQSDVAWGEQRKDSTPEFKVRRQKDWEISSAGFDRVEDSKMTYAMPDSGARLTVRKAASGFGTNFATRSIGLNEYLTSGPLGLSPTDGIAQSQQIDGTLIDLEGFRVTAFAYQNEVGRSFDAFGRTKKEFGTPGTRKMKAGANMQVGAFGFGLAQSSTENTYGSAAGALASEASASVDVPQLLRATGVSGQLAPKLIPSVWMNASTSSPASGQDDETVTMGFGGTWSWDMGYASLGYWNSSLGNNEGLGATWSGQGFDANVGAYYGAFALDVGLSYGQSEDALSSWQSVGDVYNYSATVSYKGEKLPAISLTAAMGNFDQNSISFGSTFSESYAWSSDSDYLSLSAGLDLTSLFWIPEGKEEQPSVKMLFRHSESVFSDSYSNTQDADDLVAVTIRRKF